MRIFDRGQGPVLVVVQGIHGRWEWMRPALDQLARRCRTISYSLSGDIGSGTRADPSLGLDTYVQQLDAVLDRVGVDQVAVCGVSFGGLIAVRFAARRPSRVSSLVLASAPAPGWTPNARQSRWMTRPWVSTPQFVTTAPIRLWPEVRTALPTPRTRVGFLLRQSLRAASAPIIPPLMAARGRLIHRADVADACAGIHVPTLIVTGEEELDRVVPVANTRSFCTLIRGAECQVLERTGHLGSLTRPTRFAELVGNFVHAHHH